MKTMKHFFYFALLMFGSFAYAQVGIGTNTPNHALEIESSNSGLVIPRVADVNSVTVPPVNGTMVYSIADNCIRAYESDGLGGSAWSPCLSAGGASTLERIVLTTTDLPGSYNNERVLDDRNPGNHTLELPNPSIFTGQLLYYSNNSASGGSAGTATFTSFVPINQQTCIANRGLTFYSTGTEYIVVGGF